MFNYSNLLELRLRPSRVLLLGLLSSHALALIVLASCELPPGVGAALGLLVCFSGACDLMKFSSTPPGRGIRQLSCNRRGEWTVVTADGRRRIGHAQALKLIHPWAIAFTLSMRDGRTEAVLILPDMSEPAEFHALTLWLRLNADAPEFSAPR